MDNFEIDLRMIYKEYGLKIKNPQYENKTWNIKKELMIWLNIFYRKHREKLKKIIKEDDIEKIILDGYERSAFLNNYDESNGVPINTKGNTPLFYIIEYINIPEIFGKENLDDLKQGLNKFSKKHASLLFGEQYVKKDFNFIEIFDDFDFKILIATFRIKETSILKKYIDAIEIHVQGLTASLGIINFKLYLNKKMQNILNQVALCNQKSYKTVGYSKDKKLYQFRQLGCNEISSERYKNKIKTVIEDEIKWRVLEEINKFVPLLLYRTKRSDRAISVYKTNINGNGFHNFWKSIGIEVNACDFLLDYTGCISWENIFSKDIYYIYTPKKNTLTDIYAHDIEQAYIDKLLCCLSITEAVDKLSTQYAKEAGILTKYNRKVREWLKLKETMENQLILFKRFLKEIDFNEQRGCGVKFEEIQNRCIHTKEIEQIQGENIEKSKRTLESIMNIVNANLEAFSFTSNYKLQKTTLITNAFSAVFALIAIFISLSNQPEIKACGKILYTQYQIHRLAFILICCMLVLIWKGKTIRKTISYKVDLLKRRF